MTDPGRWLWPPSRMLYLIVFLLSLTTALAQQSFPGGGGLCSDAIPCKIGCCSKNNQCGFTPEHCGEGCKHDCDSKAECGQYAERGNKDCPLNVCCRYEISLRIL
jgi:hypothetical protein